LECCLLGEEFSQLLVLGAALVNAELILKEKLFQGATTLLIEKLINLALGEPIVISLNKS
jgi:hypothetical protein